MLTDDGVFVDGGARQGLRRGHQGADRAAAYVEQPESIRAGGADFTIRAIVNDLPPSLVVDSPQGPVQTVIRFDGGRVGAMSATG
jgi:hypothetical protein